MQIEPDVVSLFYHILCLNHRIDFFSSDFLFFCIDGSEDFLLSSHLIFQDCFSM